MNATIVCLQETKMNQISDVDVLHTLGSRFKNEFAFLPADGTRGGILLACNDNYFSLSNVPPEAVQFHSHSDYEK